MRFRSVCSLMLLLVMNVSVLVTQFGCVSPFTKYELGRMSFVFENYENAIKYYTEAIKQKPNYVDAYYDRGQSYYALKKYNNAIADYNMAIELSPQRAPMFYVSRSKVFQAKNDYDQAIKDCTTAIQLNPNYFEAYYQRSRFYSQLGHHDKAIADCTTVRSLAPNDIDANFNSGNAYHLYGEALFKQQNYDAALAQYTLSIQLYSFAKDAAKRDPNYSIIARTETSKLIAVKIKMIETALAYASFVRGIIYLNKNDTPKAIYDISTTIDLEPDNYNALKRRGDTYFHTENYNRAIMDYTRLIELKPTDSLGYSLRGKVYRQIGDNASADADFAIARQLSRTQ